LKPSLTCVTIHRIEGEVDLGDCEWQERREGF